MQPERVLTLNAAPVRDRRRFILYWMQAAQRAEYNHALEFAIERANELRKPVVAVFGLTDDFPEGNLRHYRFMLEGLQETRAALAERGIGLVILHDRPDLAAIELAADAAITVVDAGWLRVQRRWRENAARRINCPLYQVETNLIVPIDEASAKEEFSAGTFRPRITKKLERFLERVPQRALKARPAHWDGKSFDVTDIAKALEQLRIERDVGPVAGFHGGTSRAKKQLAAFIEHKLDRFEKERNDPNADCTSNMSPWLHFGQISPLYIAKEVMKTRSPGVEAFLEELIVRRELSHNFVRYNTAYDTFECLPAWARRTLNFHRRDRRGYDYSPADLEHGRTHDPYWNAAQKEMVITGRMHGYMRMYWGKKLLEWCKTPRQAFGLALHLNNKYELDGRDPNGFAGVAWCFGKHDRPWGERAIFGMVRYMNDAGLKRKFDADRYVERIRDMERTG